MNNEMSSLGKLFVMYNQRTYHKTVQMWTEAVCRYVYEFYRQSIRTILVFLTEVCVCLFVYRQNISKSIAPSLWKGWPSIKDQSIKFWLTLVQNWLKFS